MITELSARNFKSWEDTGKLQFAPLTGFFGANNSGKTSMLQILLLLKQTVEQPVISQEDWDSQEEYRGADWTERFGKVLNFGDETSLINLSNFDAVIHRHNLTVGLGIFVSWKLSGQRKIGDYSPDSLSFTTSIDKKDGLDYFHYIADEYNYGILRTPEGYIIGPNGTRVNPFRCYGILSPTNFREECLPLREAFEDLFYRVHYLGPRRVDPRHDYTWEGDHPEDVGQYGEKTIPALLSGRILRRSIEEDILKRLQRLELIDSYDVLPLSAAGKNYEFLVRQYKDGPQVGLTDVGFGVSQILPVLTQCYYVPEGSILIFENPEAHLHPKAQSELADVFIDVVKNRNIQIILESHSEHLLLRLMRRIAEYGIEKEGISRDLTAFHFCEINDGISKAEQLKVDEYGNISNWPKDFFGDDMGDLVEKTKAEMQRRKAKKK